MWQCEYSFTVDECPILFLAYLHYSRQQEKWIEERLIIEVIFVTVALTCPEPLANASHHVNGRSL